MRILFFVEPVVFRRDPLFLAPHLAWVAALAAVSRGAITCALATSPALCAHWRTAHTQLQDVACFPLDSFASLAPFGHCRRSYARALYADAPSHGPLREALLDVRRRFDPDLVVLSSQNALAESAFAGLPMLRIEQAPLPRTGQPLRMVVDPLGHQVGSVLERHGARIREFELSGAECNGVLDLLSAVRRQVQAAHPHGPQAVQALRALAGGAPVALLCLQPPDWVTYEGAGALVDPEELLLQWAARLPRGWVGVPTYHPDWTLSPAMEEAIAQSCPRLRLLPRMLPQGTTEALLASADGLVTISSSSAMTAALFGKPVAVLGNSPFRAWGCHDIGDLACCPTLEPRQAAATLAFLCHRYSHVNARLLGQPGYFTGLVTALAGAPDPLEWLFDRSDFAVGRVAARFRLGAEVACHAGAHAELGAQRAAAS